MIKKIASTFYTSLFTACIGFLSLLITTKYLGAIGRGQISLLIVNIGIVQIFSAVIGSSALVYLVPRYKLEKLIFLSGVWAFICSLLVPFLLFICYQSSPLILFNTILLSFLLSLISNNSKVLIARDQILSYNLSRITQVIAAILVISVSLYFNGHLTIHHYINSLYISCLVSLAISTYFVLKGQKFGSLKGLGEPAIEFLKIGGISQFTNLIQLGNYRLSFYLLNSFAGIRALGVFSLAINLIESVAIFQSSISTIHHSDVSRQTAAASNPGKNNNRLILLSLIGTSCIVTIAMLIPIKMYLLIFGNEFSEIKNLILLLAPGVVAISAASVISHYFSGLGMVKMNTFSSAAGFAVVVISGFLLIPAYGANGAAIANSLSYVGTSAVIYWQYRKHLAQKCRRASL